MDKANHEIILEDICQEYKRIPGIMGIILFGSMARGEHHKYSDIDLYVVLKEGRVGLSMKRYQGIFVQTQWRSFDDFKKKVVKQIRSFPISLTGKILFDPTGEINNYFQKGKEVAQKGPLPLSTEEIILLRIALTEDISNIKGMIAKNKHADACLIIDEILLNVLSVFYDYNKWWWPVKKHLISDLKLKDNKFGEDIEKIILDPNMDNKYSILKKATNEVLQLIGGELDEYERVS